MPIVFEQLTESLVEGHANGALRYGARALGLGIEFGIAGGGLSYSGDGELFQEDSGITPEEPPGAAGAIAYGGEVVGFIYEAGDGLLDGRYGYGGVARGIDMLGGARGGMRYSGRAFDVAPIVAYGLFVEPDPIMVAYGGVTYESVSAGFGLGEATVGTEFAGALDRIRAAASPGSQLESLSTLAEDIEFGDALRIVFRELLAEGFSFEASAQDQFIAIQRMIEALRLSGLVSSKLEAQNAVTAAIALGALLDAWFSESVTDGIAMGDTLEATVAFAVNLVEGVLAGAELQEQVTLGVLLSDGITLTSGASASVQAIEALREGVNFVLRLNIDDGQYIAYSINTEAKGVSQYRNYPFNSFARLPDGGGWRYFGMTSEGVHELEGNTDAGSPIAGSFRLAMTNLGSMNMKRMRAAYIAYTSNGELRLKTITVGVDRQHGMTGRKQANYYRLRAQPAEAAQQARIAIGQGLRSVYWGFEVEAIDGAEFYIDLLALHPIVIDGMLQGEGGGKR